MVGFKSRVVFVGLGFKEVIVVYVEFCNAQLDHIPLFLLREDGKNPNR